MTAFVYLEGGNVLKGDRVLAAGKKATVVEVLEIGSPASANYSCPATGGLILQFDDGDLQVWPWVNEDLQLLARSGESN